MDDRFGRARNEVEGQPVAANDDARIDNDVHAGLECSVTLIRRAGAAGRDEVGTVCGRGVDSAGEKKLAGLSNDAGRERTLRRGENQSPSAADQRQRSEKPPRFDYFLTQSR